MPTHNQIGPDEKVGLILSAVERKTILVEVMSLDREYGEVLRTTPTAKPIMLNLEQWDDLGGDIATEANHTRDQKSQRKLDTIFCRIDDLVTSYSNEKPRIKLKIFRPQEE